MISFFTPKVLCKKANILNVGQSEGENTMAPAGQKLIDYMPINEDSFIINRQCFLDNMLLNIKGGFYKTLLKNKNSTDVKAKYLELYWHDVKELAGKWKITIEDLKQFTQN